MLNPKVGGTLSGMRFLKFPLLAALIALFALVLIPSAVAVGQIEDPEVQAAIEVIIGAYNQYTAAIAADAATINEQLQYIQELEAREAELVSEVAEREAAEAALRAAIADFMSAVQTSSSLDDGSEGADGDQPGAD